MYPLQSVLRNLLMGTKVTGDLSADPQEMARAMKTAQLMQYGVIVVSAVPMLCVYPFIQKYFVKGVMVGSVKG